MGKARIMTYLGDGLFLIKPLYDLSPLKVEMAALDAQDAAATEQRLPTMQAVVEVLDRIYDLEAELNVAIREYKIKKMQDDDDDESQPNEDNNALPVSSMIDLSGYGFEQVTMPELPKISPVILNLIKKLGVARRELAAREKVLADLEMGFVTRQVRRNTLKAVIEKYEETLIQAFNCANYSIPDDTIVDTIEVPGYRVKSEPSMHINYMPAHKWNRSGSGMLRPNIAMSPEMVFINTALEPGHLRWKPRWRYGVITSAITIIPEPRCDVELEAAYARKVDSAPAMSLNQDNTTLKQIMFDHPCPWKFEQGDSVIVEYNPAADTPETAPRVIGWRSHPRSCANEPPIPCPNIRIISWGSGIDNGTNAGHEFVTIKKLFFEDNGMEGNIEWVVTNPYTKEQSIKIITYSRSTPLTVITCDGVELLRTEQTINAQYTPKDPAQPEFGSKLVAFTGTYRQEIFQITHCSIMRPLSEYMSGYRAVFEATAGPLYTVPNPLDPQNPIQKYDVNYRISQRTKAQMIDGALQIGGSWTEIDPLTGKEKYLPEEYEGTYSVSLHDAGIYILPTTAVGIGKMLLPASWGCGDQQWG